jgi:HSP20 family molecular chaperone IbpA
MAASEVLCTRVLLAVARSPRCVLPFAPMSTSPFHGIFGALNAQAQERQSASAKKHAHQEAAIKPTRPNDETVGKLAVDVYEQDGYYVIRAPIAGVRMADIDVEIDESVITIRGRRREPDAIIEDQYFVQECYWGPFARKVTLPLRIDPKKVKATFNKEGVLKILVPKEEHTKSVRVTEV